MKKRYAQPLKTLEIEVAEGLEEIGQQEILTKFPKHVTNLFIDNGTICFQYDGDLSLLTQLRIPVAIYLYNHYDIPRPKALLGHQNFNLLFNSIKNVVSLSPEGYTSFHISAAGSNSPVMERLKTELSSATGLINDDVSGDLLIRIRRIRTGWDVLIRLTPRPLSVRRWRVCNFNAALNAPLAAAMIMEMQPQLSDRFLNLMCGSGTLLIERLHQGQNQLTVGLDIDINILGCAQENIKAAGFEEVLLGHADAMHLPFNMQTFNVVCIDLPFGQRISSHAQNEVLYPIVLEEVARVSTQDVRFVLITHEIRLIEQTIARSPLWIIEKMYRVSQRGYLPGIYVLSRI